MPLSRWRVAEALKEGLAPELERWPRPFRQVLFNRGLRTAAEVESFLHPEKAGMLDPFLLEGMEAAVERVDRALGEGQMIGVYGDFDADGLTGTALLAEVLGWLSHPDLVTCFVPHRTRDGYGLHASAMRSLADQDVRLIVTVDCGVGADREILLARELGVDVIVTDHHTCSDGDSPALAMVNPRQPGCPYPNKALSGVGVAYKLAEALLARRSGMEMARQSLERQLDLVALGTVADLVPLLGENRLLVRLGIQQIGRGTRPGLRALVAAAGFSGRAVGADAVAYALGPRLNAAGRMGDARPSLELLTSRSESDAAGLAADLDAANRERQASTAAALRLAREELAGLVALPPAIVLAGDYPAGVMGLVASRLAEEHRRPSFVIELGESECRGSGRGVSGFDVIGALGAASYLLTRFGGHTQAGGFTIATEKLPELRAVLESAAREQLGEDEVEAELVIDAQLRLADIGPTLYRWLDLLEPFGAGNPRPVFWTPRLVIRDARLVGTGHLKLWLADSDRACPAIGFGMGTEEWAFARSGALVDCAYTIASNERNGTVGYEMVLKELRPYGGRSGG